MEELISTIAKALVDHPEEVSVDRKETENEIVFTLSVHKDDVGKVIGKQGRIAKAFRTVVYAAGNHSNKRVFLDIND
ncbi:KH domain-containing protein [Bacillus kexueae]|uniref:KH domain-containing protein n=1 Tax=Aeribacillus kexueae TaxID=2078952 RepID=UPI001FAF1FFE|nr:KH domain-containing protein [Bacillus kexueae]